MIIAKNNHLDLATFLVEKGDYVFNDDLLLKLSSKDIPNIEVLKMVLTKTNADLDKFVYYLPRITLKKDLMWLMSFNGGPTQQRLGKMFRNLVDVFDLELLQWFKRTYQFDLNNLYTYRYLETALDENIPENDGDIARWLVTEGQVDVNNTILGLPPVVYACVEAVETGTLNRKNLCLAKNLVEICDASLDDIHTHKLHKNVWTVLLPFWQMLGNSEEDDLMLENCLETFLSNSLPPSVIYEALVQTRYVDMVERLVDKDKMVIRGYMDAVDTVNLMVMMDMVIKNPLLRESVDEKGRTAAMRHLSNLGHRNTLSDFQGFGLLSTKDTLENLCDFAVTLSGKEGFQTLSSLIMSMNFSDLEQSDAIYSSFLAAARSGNIIFLHSGFAHYTMVRDLRPIDEAYQGFLDANRTSWQHSRFLDNLFIKLHDSTQMIVDWLSSTEGRIHVNKTLNNKSMMMKLLEKREWRMATQLIERANPLKTYIENLDWVSVREDDSSEDAFALVKAILVRTDLPNDIFQTLTSSRTHVSQNYINLFREGDQAREAVAELMNQRQRTMRRMSQGKIAKTVMNNILQFDDLDDVSHLTTADMYALPRSNLVISRTFQR
jgi:hypothetical protein